jgi:sugar phosphate isomerase/epimerase
MKRREFLQIGAGTLLTGTAGLSAIAPAAQAGTASAQPNTGGRLKVDAYSRHLQWLRSADEVAEATTEMAFDGVNVTVRPYPGHVNPDQVSQELPPFVNTLRKHGLLVRSITTNISDADSPNADRIVATAASLGLTHFWWGTYRYEPNLPIFEQLDALKPRVAKVAALSEKYKITAMYHTYSGAGQVGSAVWDLLYVLKGFDPKFVGFHYDTGHQAHHTNGLWEVNLRAAGPYVAALAVKDYAPEQDLGLKGEGGPYTGPAGALGGGRGDGPPGGGRGPAAGAGAAGRGDAASQPAGAGRGGAGGRGDGAGRGGARGPTGAPRSVWAAGNGWRSRQVPLGTGVVDLPHVAAVLKDIHFSGPIEIQAEYPNGGAENAQDTITLPRIQVLGAMKRDLLTLRRGFASSGLL